MQPAESTDIPDMLTVTQLGLWVAFICYVMLLLLLLLLLLLYCELALWSELLHTIRTARGNVYYYYYYIIW